MLEIALKTGLLEIGDIDIVSVGEIMATNKIATEQTKPWAALIPENNPWHRKVQHGIETGNNIDELLAAISWPINHPYSLLLKTTGTHHDAGRSVDYAFRNPDKTPPIPLDRFTPKSAGGDHGIWGVELMKTWQIDEILHCPEAWEVIQFPIKNHSGVSTPELPFNATNVEKLQYAITCLLMDADKKETMDAKTDLYLNNVQEKIDQTKIMVGIVPNFQPDEDHVSARALEAFRDAECTKKSFDRKICANYADYMLNFFSWLFDINTKYMFDKVMASGWVNQMLAYFRQHLSTEQFNTIAKTIQDYKFPE